MKNQPRTPVLSLSCHVPGFHQYCLEGTPRLLYASEHLCRLLGFSEDTLLEAGEDRYALLVHPEDRDAYAAFLRDLGSREQTATIRYRLLKSDGKLLHVSDTMTSWRQDGQMLGDSVLTDITHLKQENQNLQFLNETIPCGFIKYTCEKQPRITYLNDRMRQFLRLPGDGEELFVQNIYLMIPVEDRQRFAGYLDRVDRKRGPLAGGLSVLRCDGTKGYLFGWVTKCVNDRGEEEFQSVCMDITQQHQAQKDREAQRYLNALTEVYDKVFAYDLASRTVKCLCSHQSPMFRWIENVPMQMEEATEKWILGSVCQEDRERVCSFFADFWQQRPDYWETPPAIRYCARSSDGTWKNYSGLFVKMDASVSLYCCRNVQQSEEADSLRSENTSLKGMNENMQKLVMRFTDGLAAFEVVDDVVTPLYASDNVCQFFGFTREEWLAVMKKRTPITEFVSRCKVDYQDFAELLEKGEAEFIYFDLDKGRDRRIRAICSQKSPEARSPRYIMLYNMDTEPMAAREPARVRIRTFGYFDVFVDGKPIAFRNEKSRELFALLTDRRGGFVSSEEAISYLWEDEPANAVTLARYRKVALRLKNLLEEYGIGDVVESVNGKRRLVTEKVSCDLYDYLSGQEAYSQLFKGSYLSNYSWGETTLAELTGDHFYGTGE